MEKKNTLINKLDQVSELKGFEKTGFQVNELFILNWRDNLIELSSVSFSIEISYIVSLKI